MTQNKVEDPAKAKVIEWQPPHFLKMINWAWQCYHCKKEHSASMSEEEDLAQQVFVTITCRYCGYNNRIFIADIYKKSPAYNQK